jgi:hypothetical protein
VGARVPTRHHFPKIRVAQSFAHRHQAATSAGRTHAGLVLYQFDQIRRVRVTSENLHLYLLAGPGSALQTENEPNGRLHPFQFGRGQ